MELKFTKEHGGWVSEFEATADFNLHVEGVYEGNVSIYQRGTAGGGYAFVKDSRPAPSAGTVYDYDFTSLVYPKFIKVVCTEEPTYAEVVTTGEVTELKHQSKAVEITANGTTSITPDAGFAALNAVEVKVNVPTSGGGGSAEEKFGMVYVTKADIFTLMELPQDTDIPQDEFGGTFIALTSTFPFVANKGIPSNPKVIQSAVNYYDDIAEGRFTCAAWTASALDWDRWVYKDGEFIPKWKTLAPTLAEAKAVLSQMFPNQMTEAEFFA